MNIKILLIMSIFILVISCGNSRNNEKNIDNRDIYNKNKFVGQNVDYIKNLIIEKSKKNGLELTEFETISYDINRYYSYAYVVSNIPIVYYVEYQNIDEVHSLVARISDINNDNLDFIKEVVVNLIECTDTSITRMRAEEIFTELITKISEKSFSSFLLNNNNLSYGIQLELETGDLIFVARP